MAILPPASSSLPSSSEGICCSMSYGITSNSIKLPIDGRRWHDLASTRCKCPFFGSPHLLWLSTGHDLCLSKVNVAADYSDSIPDSSDPMDEQGYHPLEELKGSDDVRPARLSPAEIAKTTVEANKSALLVFPGMVHCEPHEQISWAEFQYHIDDVGDIYFEISDDANPLADLGATNPVNALIGMDIPIYDNNRRTASEYDIFNNGNDDELTFDDDDIEVSEMEEFNIPGSCWGQSNTTNPVHPIYFSKCLTKAKFLKPCGTLQGIPVEIRKASEKLKASPAPDKDSDHSRFHSWLPNTSVEKLQLHVQPLDPRTPINLCQKLGNSMDSFEHTPISCISKAQDTKDDSVDNMEKSWSGNLHTADRSERNVALFHLC